MTTAIWVCLIRSDGRSRSTRSNASAFPFCFGLETVNLCECEVSPPVTNPLEEPILMLDALRSRWLEGGGPSGQVSGRRRGLWAHGPRRRADLAGREGWLGRREEHAGQGEGARPGPGPWQAAGQAAGRPRPRPRPWPWPRPRPRGERAQRRRRRRPGADSGSEAHAADQHASSQQHAPGLLRLRYGPARLFPLHLQAPDVQRQSPVSRARAGRVRRCPPAPAAPAAAVGRAARAPGRPAAHEPAPGHAAPGDPAGRAAAAASLRSCAVLQLREPLLARVRNLSVFKPSASTNTTEKTNHFVAKQWGAVPSLSSNFSR